MILHRGIDPGLAVLLEKSPSEELEYGFVMDCLKQYKNPRVKLNALMKIGALIRVKKGIYLFGKTFSRQPYCLEVLANMIQGPSYVSLEWACQYWRLIPERVMTVTSVTTKRSVIFSTPIGTFTYDHQPLAAYPIGVTYERFSDTQRALIATKEKALVDLLVIRRGSFPSVKQLKETLFEDLRIEAEDLENFSIDLVEEIHNARPHSATKHLIQFLHSIKREKK